MRKMVMGRKNKLILAIFIVTLIAIMVATACSRESGSPVTSQPHVQQGGTGQEAPLVKVPDLRGCSLEELAQEFEGLGFMPLPLMFVSNEPKDTVLFIDRMGQHMQAPATIEVYVSAGPPDWYLEAPSEGASDSGSTTQRQQYESMEFGGIEWLVLEEDGGKVLLLSKFVILDKAYNTEFVPVTWEVCTLRSYLNNEFFNSFSPEERERIAETRVINDDVMSSLWYYANYGITSWLVPGGNDTDDRVFLLSHDETMKYFPTDSSRVVRRLKDDAYNPGADWFWCLRTPGYDNYSVKAIIPTGLDVFSFRINRNFGIRPALWLYLDEE